METRALLMTSTMLPRLHVLGWGLSSELLAGVSVHDGILDGYKRSACIKRSTEICCRVDHGLDTPRFVKQGGDTGIGEKRARRKADDEIPAEIEYVVHITLEMRDPGRLSGT